MNWNKLTQLKQLDQIDSESATMTVLIFKHSTRCSISDVAISRIERNWNVDFKVKPYYLDLLVHRDISSEIAERYHVEHQSPQVLVIAKGKSVFTASHSQINVTDILNHQ